MQKRTVAQLLQFYRESCDILRPSRESAALSADLWTHWEADPSARPDVASIAARVPEIEQGFFSELVKFAREFGDLSPAHEVTYCAFVTVDYNLSAMTASDGYIVLVDDAFLQFLFHLCLLLMIASYEDFDEATTEALKREIQGCYHSGYVDRVKYTMPGDSTLARIMTRDYENTAAAGYLFQAMKGFLLAHELGHHALHHTGHPSVKSVTVTGNEATLSIPYDEHRLPRDEFAADAFGCRVIQEFMRKDAPVAPLQHFLYAFPFAPLLLFDICARLAQKVGSQDQTSCTDGAGYTHPLPAQRRQALIDTFDINAQDDVYGYLLEALDEYLPAS